MLKLASIAFALAAMASVPGASAQDSRGTMSPADRAACAAQGGVVKRMGLLGYEQCELRYKDAGKVCTAKRDCAGQCLYQGDPKKASRRPKGICQPTNNGFGCYAFIDDKRRVRTICVD